MIERAPEHFSIFTPKPPRWDRFLDLPSFALFASLFGCLTFAAAKLGNAAFEHPDVHGVFAAKVLAGVLFILGTFCGAIAGKMACRIAGI